MTAILESTILRTTPISLATALLFVTPVQAPGARRGNTSSLLSYSEPVRLSDQGYGHQVEITPPQAGLFITY